MWNNARVPRPGACTRCSPTHLAILLCARDTRTQVIKDTDAADARYCGGAMTGVTGACSARWQDRLDVLVEGGRGLLHQRGWDSRGGSTAFRVGVRSRRACMIFFR